MVSFRVDSLAQVNPLEAILVLEIMWRHLSLIYRDNLNEFLAPDFVA